MSQPSLANITTIISDLDDTLLNEDSEISPYTLQVIKECTKRGIRFIPASGRLFSGMSPLVKQMETNAPYIAGNGVQIINSDHQIMETLTIPVELSQKFFEFMKPYQYYIQVYDANKFYYAQENEISTIYRRRTQMEGVAVGDLVKFTTFDIPKMLIVHHAEDIEKLQEKAIEQFDDRLSFCRSMATFLEVLPKGISKGEAVLRLQKKYPFDLENTLVFGDNYNDISMLSLINNSVAVENACKEAKDTARYQCGHHAKDGVAHFIAENVLGI